MTSPASIEHLWIVGSGRLGLALGWELWQARVVRTITYGGRAVVPPSHPVFTEAKAAYIQGVSPPPSAATLLLLAVPDESVETVAAGVANVSVAPATVLHTSGVLGSDVLDRLATRGWSAGSIHPLVSIPDPLQSSTKLRGAWFGLEGAPRALALAESIVSSLDGHPIRIPPGGKASYHAAAVLASNYLVSLLAVAVRLMTDSGVAEETARQAIAALSRGALDDVAAVGPEMALTGPILRGDLRTIELHLTRLSPGDRALYSVLGQQAVAIAVSRGMATATAERIMKILEAVRP